MTVPDLTKYVTDGTFNSKNSDFYKDNNGKQFVNFNANVRTTLSGSLDELLGNGGINAQSGIDILNPD
jgi:hypothetical protein